MKTTPNFGFQVAEGPDPAKQYPTAVDDPFKTTLDTLLLAVAKDTGWRNIASLLVNGWTGSLMIRRAGVAVWIQANLTVPATWNLTVCGTPPAGFGASVSAYVPFFLNTTGAVFTGGHHRSTPTALLDVSATSPPAAGTGIRTWLSYSTIAPWPTTLPGVPGLLRDGLADRMEGGAADDA